MSFILIVDDDEDFANAAATVLRKDEHEVEIKLETGSVIEALEKKCPDLLILDVMFPENDCAGFELARKIRKKGECLKRLPVLMLTAVNQKFPLGFGPNDIDEEWLPVTDFLEKPVDFDALRKRVAERLAKGCCGEG